MCRRYLLDTVVGCVWGNLGFFFQLLGYSEGFFVLDIDFEYFLEIFVLMPFSHGSQGLFFFCRLEVSFQVSLKLLSASHV